MKKVLLLVLALMALLFGCSQSLDVEQDTKEQVKVESRSTESGVLKPLRIYAVGDWTFDNLRDPLRDYSFYRNNLKSSGTVRFLTNQGHKTAYFNGRNSYLYNKSKTLNLGTSDFTISGTIKTTSRKSNNTILDKRSRGTGYHVTLYHGRVILQMTKNNKHFNYWLRSSKKVNDGKWHNFKIDVDRDSPSGFKLYIDGRYQGSMNPRGYVNKSIDTIAPLYIGKHSDWSSANFTGYISRLTIEKRKSTPNSYVQWDFNDFKNPYKDISGNKAHLSSVGNVLKVNKLGEKAVDFTRNSYLKSNSSKLNLGTKDFTISGKLLTTSRTTNNTFIDKRGGGSGYTLSVYAGTILFQMQSGNRHFNYWLRSSKKVNDGKWHTFKITVDRDSRTGLKIYVDGQLQKTFNPLAYKGKSLNTKAQFLLGRHSYYNTTFDGLISDIKIDY